MDDVTGRRRFIQLAGTGTALSIAGCNALQSDDGSPGEDTSGDGTDTVTVQVQGDQQELREKQMELQQQLQNEEISQAEARQESQRIQQEMLTSAIEAFESNVDEESALTVEDSVDQYGVFLVSGSASALLGTLSYEEVGGLFSADTFEQAKQAQGGQGTATPSE